MHFGYESEFLQPRWTPLPRVALGALGLFSCLSSAKLQPEWKTLARWFGVASLLRAVSNRNVTELVGLIANPVIRLNRTIILNSSIDGAFSFLRDFSNYPKFMSHISEVRLNDRGGLRWTAKGVGHASVHWDTFVVGLLENQLISWKSATGAVVQSTGSFQLSQISDGRTRIQVQLSYAPPGGALGYATVHFLGFDPRLRMDEDLQILKKLIEQKAAMAG
ncbi:MAG: SRPBCC family protein [Methylotenera sp.]|nr:SRPBCC family protein [Oligoflexia bacterium]